MGMYDYIGTSGKQVKCFYVPCISVLYDKETKNNEVNLRCSGGHLNKYSGDVPYKTRYYSYGKDFAILDYLFVDEPIIHIIKDGKYVETMKVSNIPLGYEIPCNTITKHGSSLNIKSVNDLYDFIAEDKICKIQSDAMEAKMFRNANLTEKWPNPRTSTEEEVQAYFEKENAIRDQVYNEIKKPFHDKWFVEDANDDDITLVGLVLDDYDFCTKENKYDMFRHEYEWYLIFTEAYNRMKEMFGDPIATYFQWCEKQGIVVDKEWVLMLFEKYTKPAPNELIEEYRQRKEKK